MSSQTNAPDVNRFSQRLEDFRRFRPRYPAQITTILRSEIGLLPAWKVLDVGCGTGLSSRLFLEAGCEVCGIEPQVEMRKAAESELGSSPKFRVLAGTGEAIPLPDQSSDLIVCGESLHWLDLPRARTEFLRVLRRAGVLVLLWDSRVPGSSEVIDGIAGISAAFRLENSVRRITEITDEEHGALFGGADYRHVTLPAPQNYDLEQFQGLLRSYSSLPTIGEERCDDMMAAAAELFARHQQNGRLQVDFRTQLYFGRLR